MIDLECPLALVLWDVYKTLNETFIFIIDEWDAIYRESDDAALQMRYTNLLRSLFKGSGAKAFIRLAYLTGILPIKRYNSESALNNFYEYTMTGSFGLSVLLDADLII